MWWMPSRRNPPGGSVRDRRSAARPVVPDAAGPIAAGCVGSSTRSTGSAPCATSAGCRGASDRSRATACSGPSAPPPGSRSRRRCSTAYAPSLRRSRPRSTTRRSQPATWTPASTCASIAGQAARTSPQVRLAVAVGVQVEQASRSRSATSMRSVSPCGRRHLQVRVARLVRRARTARPAPARRAAHAPTAIRRITAAPRCVGRPAPPPSPFAPLAQRPCVTDSRARLRQHAAGRSVRAGGAMFSRARPSARCGSSSTHQREHRLLAAVERRRIGALVGERDTLAHLLRIRRGGVGPAARAGDRTAAAPPRPCAADRLSSASASAWRPLSIRKSAYAEHRVASSAGLAAPRARRASAAAAAPARVLEFGERGEQPALRRRHPGAASSAAGCNARARRGEVGRAARRSRPGRPARGVAARRPPRPGRPMSDSA